MKIIKRFGQIEGVEVAETDLPNQVSSLVKRDDLIEQALVNAEDNLNQ